MDAFETREYRMRGIDGGIRMSIVAAAAIVAPQNARGYPTLICQGMSSLPSAVASATAEPDTPPKSVDPSTLTCACPPRKRPTRSVAKSIRYAGQLAAHHQVCGHNEEWNGDQREALCRQKNLLDYPEERKVVRGKYPQRRADHKGVRDRK